MEDAFILYAPYLLALVYLINGSINAVGPKGMRESYERWGYPKGFNYVTATLQITSAVLIIVENTILYGITLGALVLGAAILTLAKSREWSATLPAIVLLAISMAWIFMR